MEVPEDLRYAENHEWARVVGDGRIRVGITDYAQDALGDIVFVGLPDVGSEYTAGAPFGEVESTKSVSDVYAPTAGAVSLVNEALEATPELINADPYGDGWFIELDLAQGATLDRLMDAAAYRAYSED